MPTPDIDVASALKAMRDSEERQTFLLMFSDTLRAETGVEAVGSRAVRMIADQMQLDRVYLVTLTPDDDNIAVTHEARRETLPPLKGSYRGSDFPSALKELFDRTIVYNDVRTDPRLGDLERLAFAGLGAVGFMATPIRRGREAIIWAAGAVSASPREWTSADVTLFQEAIERTWAAIERAHAETALRDSEERQAFLLRLSDALRPLSDAALTRAAACTMLAEALGASRVYYVDFASEAGFGVVADDYAAEGLPSLAGRYAIAAFERTYERHRQGTTWVVDDVTEASEIAAAEAEYYAARQVIAFVDVPLLKAGELRSVLCVVQTRPRAWTAAEVGLIKETAERVWEAIERGRAEAGLREREQRLTVALEAGRMGTYRLDLRTGEQQWSPQQYDILGLTPGAQAPSREVFLSLVHPEDRGEVEFTPNDIRVPGTYLDSAFRITRPDGETRWIAAHALAVFGPDGHPVELIGVNQDVTERRRLEAAMHSSEERLQELGEASQDVIWIRDARTLQWEYLSPAFHKIYGISREDALRGDNYRSWLDLILPEDREGALANIEKVRAGERVAFEYRVRRPEDGRVRWLRNTDFPIRDEHGAVVRVGGIGHDLTEIKQAEEHQRMLTAELQHRVRNTLAVIRSIARRTARSSDTVEDFSMNLEGRIDAFARVQAAVTRDPAAGVDLNELVAEELRSASAREGEGLSIDGPVARLKAKPAETVALGLHELVTNAIKYGALTQDQARLAIGWRLERGPGTLQLVFSWKESGVRVAPGPRRAGLGTEILSRTLPYDLGGTAELGFENDGVAYTLHAPGAVLVGHD